MRTRTTAEDVVDPADLLHTIERARILYDAERFPEALDELHRVLDLNQYHEDALQLAGYISAKEGQDDQAREYYSQYLEQKQKLLDVKRQADSRIRRTIAREREWLSRTPKSRTTQSQARV